MFARLISLAAFVLMVSQACNAVEVARWDFEETSGTTATDQSGQYVATLAGSDTLDVDGRFGSGIDFAGDGGATVDAASSEAFRFTEDFSIVLWVNSDVAWGDYTRFVDISAADGGLADSYRLFTGSGASADNFRFMSRQNGSNTSNIHTRDMAAGTWILLVVRHDLDGDVTMNVLQDGDSVDAAFVAANSESWPTAGPIVYAAGELKFGRMSGDNRKFDGKMDAVAFYDEVLTDDQVVRLFSAAGSSEYPLAAGPAPADGAILEATWANLGWRAGDYAVSHDLYFGTGFDDVNDGTADTFVGNQAGVALIVGFPGFPVPDGLVPGTTYYWRVDEVNDTAPNSPWKGPVWSFSVPPKNAYNLDPVDGAKFIDPDVTVSWTPGFSAKLHHVYFGDNVNDVNEGAPSTYKGAVTELTFVPGTLEMDKAYYWRVDEFDGAATNTGDVVSFSTMPVIDVADPTLIGWWKFDAGVGSIAPDWSGHGNHGMLVNPNWLSPGWIGPSAMDFGSNSYMAIRNLVLEDANETEVSVSAWVRTSSSGMQTIVSFDRSDYWRFEIGSQYVSPGQVGWEVSTSSGVVDLPSQKRIDDGQWHHVAGIFDNGTMTIYIDGAPDATAVGGSTFGIGSTRYGFVGSQSEATVFDGDRSGSPGYWMGSMDDVRIYNRALTQDDVVQVMRGDPLLAWDHRPPSGRYDIEAVPSSLTWSSGDMAAQHDVYFGTDEQAVQNAEATDTTGIYRRQQAGTTYTPVEPLEWGQDYFWRIDELNTDGTISRGGVRAIMVADFRLVDDFESYTDNDADNKAIWQHWIDGFGVPTNGSQVGYVLPPYAEQTIVNSGAQSMPFFYDNTAGVANSQAELVLISPRDWTAHGVGVLSLWFRGYPPRVGSFAEGPIGTFTVTAAGADIAGTADQFHFAYKTLTGPGSITARVDSILNTHDQAKAGVMIRETLDPNSAHAFACVTPGNGVGSLGRTTAAGSSFSTLQAGITAPHWVKLERDVSGNFTVSHSANGSAWQPVELSVPTTIPMDGTVYVGLALTSRNAAATCEGRFSNVTITGNAGLQWAHQDIGILANDAEPLYVAVTDGAGVSAVVSSKDANAATTDVWTEWVIDLQAFVDQGVNLANVDKIAIGLGSKGNANANGGSGTMFFDDIRLLRPAEEPQP